MTTPTFQELLTSQDARYKVTPFSVDPQKGSHWMTPGGVIWPIKCANDGDKAIWQGYIQEAAPPPEPRVFNKTLYFNVYDDDGVFEEGHLTRDLADEHQSEARIACVRVEITATEGQFDD